ARGEELEAHVEGCALCQRELERLTEPAAALRNRTRGIEPAFPGEEACWLQVQAALGETASYPAGQEQRAGNSAAGTAPPRGHMAGYQILEELGRGATGVVYQARRLAADQLVAVKILRARPHRDALARFRREIEALVWLSHPHIVKIYEVGEHQGRPFFAMEYVSGGNLQTRLSGRSLP